MPEHYIRLVKYFLLAFLFFYHQSYCQQQVAGVVINGEDGSRLAAASVFINNTSRGTTTNADGKFVITGLTQKHFELIVSFTGFITASINITAENINEFFTIKLYPRKQELAEVSIMMPEKDGWTHWGKLFTDLFIGTSDFAHDCTIENPEVLRFTNNKKSSQLHAYSNSALIIHNNSLGYNVKYQLEEFIYDFKNRVITYTGYSTFENMPAKSKNKIKRWERNRQEVYEGSLVHFMRSVYSDSVAAKGFDVRSKIRIYSEDSAFNQIYKSPLPHFARVENKIYRIRPAAVNAFKKIPPYIDLLDTAIFSFKNATKLNAEKKERSFYFENYLEITYKNAFEKADFLRQNFLSPLLKIPQNSDITLVTDTPIIIEPNGYYFNPLNVLSSGYMGWHKMAETLPSDYIYDRDVSEKNIEVLFSR